MYNASRRYVIHSLKVKQKFMIKHLIFKKGQVQVRTFSNTTTTPPTQLTKARLIQFRLYEQLDKPRVGLIDGNL